RSRGAAVRVLPARHDHGGRGIARGKAQADRRGHRREDHQHLSLRDVPTGSRGHSRRGEGIRGRAMITKLNRRSFVIGTTAADAWSVPAAECSAANSVITHKPSGRTITYGKVAEAAAKLTPPEKPTLKDPKDWKLIGKSVKRLDTVEKITGAQVYGADLKFPG